MKNQDSKANSGKTKEVRLQIFLARAGVASRRKAEELIKSGKVKIDGRIVDELGFRVDPETAEVEVNGVVLKKENKRYILLNKPGGYICSVSDGFGRPIVLTLLPGVKERVYPVGRLDLNTEGLLILSNDGDFCHRLTHPHHRVNKRYLARVKYPVTASQLKNLSAGVDIGDDRLTAPARIRMLGPKQLELIIREGRKRQVRRMLESVGNRVVHLKRTGIGSLQDDCLPQGKWRELTGNEVEDLIRGSKIEK